MTQTIKPAFNETARNYMIFVPATFEIKAVLTPETYDRLKQEIITAHPESMPINEDICHAFSHKIAVDLSRFLKSRNESPEITYTYSDDTTTPGCLTFKCSDQTAKKLKSDAENVFKNLGMSEIAQKAGYWKKLTVEPALI